MKQSAEVKPNQVACDSSDELDSQQQQQKFTNVKTSEAEKKTEKPSSPVPSNFVTLNKAWRQTAPNDEKPNQDSNFDPNKKTKNLTFQPPIGEKTIYSQIGQSNFFNLQLKKTKITFSNLI